MKKNLTLVVGLLIPIVMIFSVALMIYIPSYYIKPNYNFVYATGGNYFWPSKYTVQNQKITIRLLPVNKLQPKSMQETLYLYDVKNNEAKEISYAQAQHLILDPIQKSPDGFKISYGTSTQGFFPLFVFRTIDYDKHYLHKNTYSQKLQLKLSGEFYNNFYFIGWVLHGKTTNTQ